MMCSKRSRRIDPISRSAKPFCQGEAGGSAPSASGTGINAPANLLEHDPKSVRFGDEIVRGFITGSASRGKVLRRDACADEAAIKPPLPPEFGELISKKKIASGGRGN